jgi:hypothetical protein
VDLGLAGPLRRIAIEFVNIGTSSIQIFISVFTSGNFVEDWSKYKFVSPYEQLICLDAFITLPVKYISLMICNRYVQERFQVMCQCVAYGIV